MLESEAPRLRGLLQRMRNRPKMPVIGFLGAPTALGWTPNLATFIRGLSETEYYDGRNVAIEYRWADDQYDRLPALAADLVARRVNVIAAATTPAALAAKTATTTIPIVFTTVGNPVQIGLVASLNRPGGNVTGVTQLNVEIAPKMVELLHEAIPAATSIAALVNPGNPNTEVFVRNVQAAAGSRGLQLHVFNARDDHGIETAFASIEQSRIGGLVISGDPVFGGRSERLATLALRHRVPAIFFRREFTAAGGLMSYGGSNTERIVRPASTPAEFSKAKSPPICPSSRRPRLNWPSTSRAPRRSALPCRFHNWAAPTR